MRTLTTAVPGLILAIVCCAPATSASVPFTLNFNGSAPNPNGMAGNPPVGDPFEPGTSTGTISPFGAASASMTVGYFGVKITATATFTIADGSSFTGTFAGTSAIGANIYSFSGNIASGTGIFAQTSGSLQGTLTITNFSSAVQNLTYTVTGSGTVNTSDVKPELSVFPRGLTFSTIENASSPTSQIVVVDNPGPTPISFKATPVTKSGGNWLSVSSASGVVAPSSFAVVSAIANAGSLKAGTYLGSVSLSISPGNQQFDVSVIASVSAGQSALRLSQTGFLFETVEAGGTPPSQSITVLNAGAGTLNFSISTSTLAGGPGWLSASPASGSATPVNPATATISINPAGLAAGNYYGQVQFTATGVANSPQIASVVLKVAPAGTDLGAFVYPTGLIFVATAGGANPPAKPVSVTSPSSALLSFETATLFGSRPVTVFPPSGDLNTAKPAQVTVQPTTTGLAAGVYSGELVLQFSDLTARRVAVVLIVIPGGAPANMSSNAAAPRAATCTPTKLIPVFTQLGAEFTTVAAWPTPIEASIVDDCGNPLTTGDVVASFSNGDEPLPLTSLNDGRWSATWQPRASATQVTITVQAQEDHPRLEGIQSIAGALEANPSTPFINAGGVVSAAKYAKNQPLAPGSFASIYGLHLSSGQNPALALPLATQLGGTQVFLGGRQLPLQFTTDGQINAIVPYDVAANTTLQLIVMNGPTLSVPEPVVIGPAQPAVFTQADGSGVIFGVKSGSTTQFLVDPSHPVSAGDAIVIYCAGLGPVNPPVEAGSAAPSSPPAVTTNPVTVTIGGKDAKVFFSGLVGGFAGLYQVNAYVPAGLTPGATVPLAIDVASFESAPVTIAIK